MARRESIEGRGGDARVSFRGGRGEVAWESTRIEESSDATSLTVFEFHNFTFTNRKYQALKEKKSQFNASTNPKNSKDKLCSEKTIEGGLGNEIGIFLFPNFGQVAAELVV